MNFHDGNGKLQFADEWEQEEYLRRQKERHRGDDFLEIIKSFPQMQTEGCDDLLLRLMDVKILANFMEGFLQDNRLRPSEYGRVLDLYHYTLDLKRNIYKEIGLE